VRPCLEYCGQFGLPGMTDANKMERVQQREQRMVMGLGHVGNEELWVFCL